MLWTGPCQLWTGPCILKLTEFGQCADVLEIHLSTHRPIISKTTQVFKTISDQQLFARELKYRQSHGCSTGG